VKANAVVLSCGTMLGIDTETYLGASADAGFDAVSLRPAQVTAWVEAGGTLTSLRHRLDSFGLALAELDPVMAWAPGSTPKSPHSQSSAAVLAMAQELGAHAVSALVAPGHLLDLDTQFDATVEAFAALCDAAAERGVAVQLEFFGWSALHTLADALRITAAAARPNGGVLVDTWHHARRGGTLADIEAVDPARIVALQVSDGPASASSDDLAADNRHRQWLGDGELHPERVVASLRRRGWQGSVGIEVFGDASTDPAARARTAMHSFTTTVAGR
jgi:sugar phosphate isomerase/epimerase